MVRLVDVEHGGIPGVIGVFVLDGPEPALVDCGPTSSVEGLRRGLKEIELELTDVRHLLLTHIHPDHAGAAGELVRCHPGLQVHVHEIGAPHVVDPTRLLKSAARIYGDSFTPLFGTIAPVPEENVHVLSSRVLDLDVLPVPGHAYHQVAFIDDEGVAYPGDAVGCLWGEGEFLYPAAAAPEIDMPAWEHALDELEDRDLKLFRIPHFGEVPDVERHLHRTRERLGVWRDLVEGGATVDEFAAVCWRDLRAEGTVHDEEVFPTLPFPSFEMSYIGLKRYYDKARETAERGDE